VPSTRVDVTIETASEEMDTLHVECALQVSLDDTENLISQGEGFVKMMLKQPIQERPSSWQPPRGRKLKRQTSYQPAVYNAHFNPPQWLSLAEQRTLPNVENALQWNENHTPPLGDLQRNEPPLTSGFENSAMALSAVVQQSEQPLSHAARLTGLSDLSFVDQRMGQLSSLRLSSVSRSERSPSIQLRNPLSLAGAQRQRRGTQHPGFPAFVNEQLMSVAEEPHLETSETTMSQWLVSDIEDIISSIRVPALPAQPMRNFSRQPVSLRPFHAGTLPTESTQPLSLRPVPTSTSYPGYSKKSNSETNRRRSDTPAKTQTNCVDSDPEDSSLADLSMLGKRVGQDLSSSSSSSSDEQGVSSAVCTGPSMCSIFPIFRNDIYQSRPTGRQFGVLVHSLIVLSIISP